MPAESDLQILRIRRVQNPYPAATRRLQALAFRNFGRAFPVSEEWFWRRPGRRIPVLKDELRLRVRCAPKVRPARCKGPVPQERSNREQGIEAGTAPVPQH